MIIEAVNCLSPCVARVLIITIWPFFVEFGWYRRNCQYKYFFNYNFIYQLYKYDDHVNQSFSQIQTNKCYPFLSLILDMVWIGHNNIGFEVHMMMTSGVTIGFTKLRHPKYQKLRYSLPFQTNVITKYGIYSGNQLTVPITRWRLLTLLPNRVPMCTTVYHTNLIKYPRQPCP